MIDRQWNRNVRKMTTELQKKYDDTSIKAAIFVRSRSDSNTTKRQNVISKHVQLNKICKNI